MLLVVIGWIALLGTVTSSPLSSDCVKVNQCKCLMRDGSGVIDLGSVAGEDGFIPLLEPLPRSADQAERRLTLSPCQAFSQPDTSAHNTGNCSDVAACLTTSFQRGPGRVSQYVSYGRHEQNLFSYSEAEKMLSVSYYTLPPDPDPRAVVHYQCGEDPAIIYEQRLRVDGPLHVWVRSPCACPNACTPLDLGPGTIFLIILCLSAAAYFFIGWCSLRPFRTSSGIQISPEDSVWCMMCHQLRERSQSLRLLQGQSP